MIEIDLLNKYPKKRPKLPFDLKKKIKKIYLKNRTSSLSVNIFEKWGHFKIKSKFNHKQILEIGCGTLNHLPFEDLKKKKYDVVEPDDNFYLNSKLSDRKKINNRYLDINKIKNKKYDTIISCYVLEHLIELPSILAKTGLLLKKRGVSKHAIPCEGCLAWTIGRFIHSDIKFYIQTGYSNSVFMRYEHVNNFDEILKIAKIFFNDVKIEYSYPFFLSKHSSFYACLTLKNPILKKCRNYLKNI